MDNFKLGFAELTCHSCRTQVLGGPMNLNDGLLEKVKSALPPRWVAIIADFDVLAPMHACTVFTGHGLRFFCEKCKANLNENAVKEPVA